MSSAWFWAVTIGTGVGVAIVLGDASARGDRQGMSPPAPSGFALAPRVDESCRDFVRKWADEERFAGYGDEIKAAPKAQPVRFRLLRDSRWRRNIEALDPGTWIGVLEQFGPAASEMFPELANGERACIHFSYNKDDGPSATLHREVGGPPRALGAMICLHNPNHPLAVKPEWSVVPKNIKCEEGVAVYGSLRVSAKEVTTGDSLVAALGRAYQPGDAWSKAVAAIAGDKWFDSVKRVFTPYSGSDTFKKRWRPDLVLDDRLAVLEDVFVGVSATNLEFTRAFAAFKGPGPWFPCAIQGCCRVY